MNLENSINVSGLDNTSLEMIAGMLATYSLVAGLVCLLMIVELWIIFKKCGKKGWLSIVPIANVWTLFTIVDLPGWLCLIPVANFVGIIMAYIKLPNKRFGKGLGFGIGTLLLPFIFLGILAFSKSKEENKTGVSPAMEVPGEIAVNEETNNMTAPVMPEMNTGIENSPVNNEMSMPNVESSEVPDLMAAPTAQEVAPEIPEVQNTIVEEPALNLAEEPVAAPMVDTPVINPEPEVKEADVINAFEMPAPAADNVVINDIPNPANEVVQNENPTPEVDTLIVEAAPAQEPASVNIEAPETSASPFAPEMATPNIFDVPAASETPNTEPANNTQNIDADLEATFELPKMANEIINSDITATKTCPNCGHVNEYTNKTCVMCGSNLE